MSKTKFRKTPKLAFLLVPSFGFQTRGFEIENFKDAGPNLGLKTIFIFLLLNKFFGFENRKLFLKTENEEEKNSYK
jgi:hypothetical protein